MKYTMPRLIDDQRRIRNIRISAEFVLIFSIAWFAYNAWMRPFRARVEELRALSSEGQSELVRLDEMLKTDANTGLEVEKAKLLQFSKGQSFSESASISELDIDPSSFALEDRLKAEQIRTAYRKAISDWNDAKKSLDGLRAASAAQVVEIEALLANPSQSRAKAARTDLSQCLDELEALATVSRPSGDKTNAAKGRFFQAEKAAVAAQAAARSFFDSSQAVLNNAKKILTDASANVKRMKDAVANAERIRLQLQGLHPDLMWLKKLKEKLKTDVDSVGEAEKQVTDVLKSTEVARTEAIAAARKTVKEVLSTINAFDQLYDSLISQPLVQKGRDEARTFENVVKEEADGWKRSKDEAVALVTQSKALLGKANEALFEIAAALESDSPSFDGTVAKAVSAQLGKLEASLKEASERALHSVSDLKEKMEESVARIQADWQALEAAKPDLQELVKDVRENAGKAKSMLDQVSAKCTKLAEVLSDGSGSAKATLESKLSGCSVPAMTEASLLELKEASASDGKGVAALQKQLENLQAIINGYATDVRRVEDGLRKAESDGSFFRLEWMEGALGRNPLDHFTDGTAWLKDVLVPQGSSSSRQYEWRFALNISRAGEHTIEVKVEKPESDPVNEAIDAKKFVTQEGKRVKGGWIDVKCELSSGSQSWCDDVWVQNYKSFGPELVVEAHPTLSIGYQSFILSLELNANPEDAQNKGWHSDRLQFRVYLDGAPVTTFWHKGKR